MPKESTTTKNVESSENKGPSADPWRYRCPNGHASWEPLATTDEYHCKACGVRFSEEELLDLREEDTSTADSEVEQ